MLRGARTPAERSQCRSTGVVQVPVSHHWVPGQARRWLLRAGNGCGRGNTILCLSTIRFLGHFPRCSPCQECLCSRMRGDVEQRVGATLSCSPQKVAGVACIDTPGSEAGFRQQLIAPAQVLDRAAGLTLVCCKNAAGALLTTAAWDLVFMSHVKTSCPGPCASSALFI